MGGGGENEELLNATSNLKSKVSYYPSFILLGQFNSKVFCYCNVNPDFLNTLQKDNKNKIKIR